MSFAPEVSNNSGPAPSLREAAAARAAAARGNASSTTVPPPQEVPSHPLSIPTPVPQQQLAQPGQQQQQQPPATTAEEARRQWRAHGEMATQVLEDRRSNLLRNPTGAAAWSVRVLGAEERVDPAGCSYTSYILSVETANPKGNAVIEHRYSEFQRLNRELAANNIKLTATFPKKSLAGRVGNWTPSRTVAPRKAEDLVSHRRAKLDAWLVELCERLNAGDIRGVLQEEVLEFLQVSGASCPPCDKSNPVSWDGLDHPAGSAKSEVEGGKHAGGAEKHVSNPFSFTLGSTIRQATYTVMHMCGRGTLTQSDKSIPLDLLQNAKGLCFLTVAKAGCIVSGRVGTGLIIARTMNGSWSAPSAIGTVGVGWGALAGADITTYLLVLNTDRAVRAFAGDLGTVNLGAELGVAVGPVGRSATGNVSGGDGGIAQAYAYAHSKGLFVGISLEGSVVASRPEVNAKFYGRPVEVKALLFGNVIPSPRAAQPLYDALDEAMGVAMPQKGLRPSQMLKKKQTAGNVPQQVGPSAAALQQQQQRQQQQGQQQQQQQQVGQGVMTAPGSIIGSTVGPAMPSTGQGGTVGIGGNSIQYRS